MASKAARRVNKPFDPVKFETLVEPLQVRVEKERGGSRSKIPLPKGEDGSEPGENLSKAAVLGIEEWLLNKWSGGGFYIFNVTDSSVPTPQVMEYDAWYPPSEFPEKTPPTLTEAAGLPPIVPVHVAAAPAVETPVIPFPFPPQVSHMAPPPTAFPQGFPTPQLLGTQPRPPAQPSTYDAWMWAQYANPYASPARNSDDGDRKRLEDELRRKDEELRKRELEAAQAKFAADLERERQAAREAQAARDQAARDQQAQAARELAELRSLIAASATAKPAVSDSETALKAELAAMRAQMEADRREAARDKADAEMKALIAKQAEDHRREMEESRRANEAALKAITDKLADNRGPDPMLTMVKEMSRDTMEAMKEMARQNAAAIEKLEATRMHPRELFGLMKESSASVDQVTTKMAASYGALFEMHQRMTEQIVEMAGSGQPDPKLALAEKAIEKASAAFARYVGGKNQAEIAAEQSKAQVATANAEAMRAQAAALQAQAMRGNAAPQAPVAPAQPSAGIHTATTTANVAGNAAPVQPGAPVNGNAAPQPVATAPTGHEPKRLGHTDLEWFTPMVLPHIVELRAGVAHYIESISMKPPRLTNEGEIDGVDPLHAALGVDQAIAQIHMHKLNVPALEMLLKQNRVDDFVSVLLPDAPRMFQTDVTQLLLRAINGEDISKLLEADENDEEDDETPADGSTAVNGAVPPSNVVAITAPTQTAPTAPASA